MSTDRQKEEIDDAACAPTFRGREHTSTHIPSHVRSDLEWEARKSGGGTRKWMEEIEMLFIVGWKN